MKRFLWIRLVLTGLAVLLLMPFTGAAIALPGPSDRDTFQLTDEPGNWFRSDRTGTPVTSVRVGGRVDFEVGARTLTRHTATILSKPPGSSVNLDQDHPFRGKVSTEFDRPGAFLFVCKVHPYMLGAVAVPDANGRVPDVTAQQLPFIGHLGQQTLPVDTVVSVLTSIAPTDADKRAKWDIFAPAEGFKPQIPGVGEVWVNSQFEKVPGQATDGDPKPGTITVVDAGTFTVEREINGLDPDAQGWDNPHNMWANDALDVVYNGNWFGKSINKIDRASGDILTTEVVGEAPTHIVTNPNRNFQSFGLLYCPISADENLVRVQDRSRTDLHIIDSRPTGASHNHPHGHWLTGDGRLTIVPNVFKGLGFNGSVSIMDAQTNSVLREIRWAPTGNASALVLPVAAGANRTKAYVSSIASGQVSVINLATRAIVKNVPVTFTPNGKQGPQFSVFDTLQAPIQVPVSPNGRFAAAAVLSLTTVPRPPTGSADHVAIIDTTTDTVVANLATPAGTHGAHWGAKKGGGYYLFVTNQNSNALTVIDPDPNNDGSAADAKVVGRIILANGSVGAGVTDGTGGQGLKPLPNMYNGWIQNTVALSGTGRLSPEVEGWIAQLTPEQKNPTG